MRTCVSSASRRCCCFRKTCTMVMLGMGKRHTTYLILDRSNSINDRIPGCFTMHGWGDQRSPQSPDEPSPLCTLAYHNGFSFLAVGAPDAFNGTAHGSHGNLERVIVACMRFGQLNITRWPPRARDALLLLQLSASRHHHQPCHGARLRSTARATYSDLISRVYVRHHSPASGSFNRSTLKAAGTVTIFASYYRSCLRAHQRWCKPSSGHGVSFAPHFLQDIALYFVSIYLPFHLSVTLADASSCDLLCETHFNQ